MKKVLPTIIITILFLIVIGLYLLGIAKAIMGDISIDTLLLPFIILGVFSVIAVLVIIVLVKRVKAIKTEEDDEQNISKY